MTLQIFNIVQTILLAAIVLLLVLGFRILSIQVNSRQHRIEQLIDLQHTLAKLIIQQGTTITSFYNQFDQFVTVLTPILQSQNASFNHI